MNIRIILIFVTLIKKEKKLPILKCRRYIKTTVVEQG